jgi:hypothetical protein
MRSRSLKISLKISLESVRPVSKDVQPDGGRIWPDPRQKDPGASAPGGGFKRRGPAPASLGPAKAENDLWTTLKKQGDADRGLTGQRQKMTGRYKD